VVYDGHIKSPMSISIATDQPWSLWRSLLRWGGRFFLGALLWMRAVDGGHSPWEMNEALELLKVRVLLSDPQWYRTMWDDQPATLMWMLRGWFAVTGASLEAARVLVTALMTAALSAVAARAESMAGRWAGLALTPLLLVNPKLTQLLGACMLEPSSIALALMGGLLFWSRLERPTSWAIVGAGALTGWALAVKLTVALPAQLAFWVFLHALWRARRGNRALWLRILGNAGTGSGNDFRFWISGLWRKVLYLGITGSIPRPRLGSAGPGLRAQGSSKEEWLLCCA